jgi:hypothetical protein
VDPAAALGPAPAVAPEPEKIPEAAPKAAAPVSVAPAPKAPVSRLVAAFARGLVGVLPGPALALGAAYEQSLAFGGLRIDASASLVHEQRRSVRSEGFRMALASAGAMYCPLYFTRSIVRFSACLGAEGGVWYLSTFGVLSGTHKTAPFLAGSGRAGLSVVLGDHAALQLGIAADALVLRPEYTFAVADGSRETAYRAPALTALGDVGLAARF